MAVAYRIAKRKFATSKKAMMSGRGAMLHGGRWNRPGRWIVYASQSVSLATLEIAAHLNSGDRITAYRLMKLDIPEDLVFRLDSSLLPNGWDELVVEPAAAQDYGDAWYDKRLSLVMEVPSVIVPSESNFLINVEHPEFGQIRQGPIQKHSFDKRIKK